MKRKPGGQASAEGPGESEALFKQALGGVRPLSEKARRVPKQGKPPVAFSAASAGPGSPWRAGREHAIRELTVEQDEDEIRAYRDGGDRQHAQRLARGALRPALRLDLHGLTRVQAEASIDRLMIEAEERKVRCLLLVCGRGLHSGPEGPVLREATIAALSQRHADRVIAFATAPRELGGKGALLVWLQRPDRAQ